MRRGLTLFGASCKGETQTLEHPAPLEQGEVQQQRLDWWSLAAYSPPFFRPPPRQAARLSFKRARRSFPQPSLVWLSGWWKSSWPHKHLQLCSLRQTGEPHTYMCIGIYVHKSISTKTYAYTHTYMHAYTHTYTCECTFQNTRMSHVCHVMNP